MERRITILLYRCCRYNRDRYKRAHCLPSGINFARITVAVSLAFLQHQLYEKNTKILLMYYQAIVRRHMQRSRPYFTSEIPSPYALLRTVLGIALRKYQIFAFFTRNKYNIKISRKFRD